MPAADLGACEGLAMTTMHEARQVAKLIVDQAIDAEIDHHGKAEIGATMCCFLEFFIAYAIVDSPQYEIPADEQEPHYTTQ